MKYELINGPNDIAGKALHSTRDIGGIRGHLEKILEPGMLTLRTYATRANLK